MSASEILREVRAMPAREREKLFDAFLDLSTQAAPSASRKGKSVKWPDVEARARKIFGRRVLPNLVLMEREDSSS